jgi:Holliday junction resolvase RusA-like endonuclease
MSTNTLTIEIIGVPIEQHRPRFTTKGGRRAYSDQGTEKARWSLQMNAQLGRSPYPLPVPEKIPVAVEVEYIFPLLKNSTKKMTHKVENGEIIAHASKPDIDNLTKLMLDCMTGHVFADDNQVCELISRKYYGIFPKTIITVSWRPYEKQDRH